MKSTGLYPRVRVDTSATAAVGQAGGVLLTRTVMNRSGFHRGSAVLIPILSGSVCWAA